jgi:hypothetical protein
MVRISVRTYVRVKSQKRLDVPILVRSTYIHVYHWYVPKWYHGMYTCTIGAYHMVHVYRYWVRTIYMVRYDNTMVDTNGTMVRTRVRTNNLNNVMSQLSDYTYYVGTIGTGVRTRVRTMVLIM